MKISQNSGPGKIFCGYEDFSKLWAREYILWIRKLLKTLGHEKYSVDMNISQNSGPGIGFTFLFFLTSKLAESNAKCQTLKSSACLHSADRKPYACAVTEHCKRAKINNPKYFSFHEYCFNLTTN
jgi:hypothetical protein